jgi:hypothetical protein
MFWEFFSFEVKFRLKNISTYVYFGLWFFLSFLCVAAEDFGPVGNGKVLLNGPYASTMNQVLFCLFGTIVIAAIFGTSILRDFQRDTYQLIFTKPISKFAYLGGRWAGSFVTTVLIFSGLVLGEAAGCLAPWADHSRIASGHFWWYLQPFLSFTVIQIFFLGSIFFCVAALTRKIFVVYLQGVALFMLYLIGQTVFVATRSLERFWSGIFDPVGLILFNDITRYWTVVEQNTLQLSWQGIFLYNRLLWMTVGMLALATVWALFPMSVEALTTRSAAKRRQNPQEDDELRPVRSLMSRKLPKVTLAFTSSTARLQFVSLTKLRIRNILREIPFWAIMALVVVFSLVNGYFAGMRGDSNVWPVTYLMLQAVEGGAMLFFYIVATLYAGELIWRERDTNFSGIHDALPVGDVVDWGSRFAALAVVELILLTVTMFCGVIMQTVAGYYRYEFLQYFKELYVVTFPQVMTYALLAFFLHTMVRNKFIGHGMTIGIFVLMPILYRFGLENTLYLFGQTPPYTYSDMNGFGHFVKPLFWAISYWLSIAALLGLVSIAFARRGSDIDWATRWRSARGRARSLRPAMALCVLATAGTGSWYYYNTHVLNEYTTAKVRRGRQAQYEKAFKKYQRLPQPKVINVDSSINIYPDRRSFEGRGVFTLQNKTTAPITEIHLTDLMESISEVRFDRPFRRVSQSARNEYSVYALEKPLNPNEVLRLAFKTSHTARGYKDGNERPEMALNGTFFDNSYFPTIGYSPAAELEDPRRRTEEHLPPLQEMPLRGDAYGSKINLFTKDSDWITYHTIVSTSEGQVAVAPGYLKREWQENGRRYFEYDMGATRTLNFHAYLSGRYAKKASKFEDVNIEVYHDAAHTFNVDEMIQASKEGLDYFNKNFAPFQFKQYRILEFPRYRSFAQSFPNTVPFSEAIGFIGRMKSPDDINFTYFVVAHELAHQWWGHQLIGGQVQGSNMMSEALAEYSALRVMAKKYGQENMRKFLKHELDGYLRGRAGEVRKEPPLALVQRESYVWYQKGAIVLYALSDYIGEEKLNEALRTFLLRYRYGNGSDSQSADYPDTRQFVEALRSVTPPELQYYITDAFESIVLYDNKAITATVTPTSDHKFKVTLTVKVRKLMADGSGNETPMPLNDFIDVGVFAGKKSKETPLQVRKERITQEDRTFEIIVDQKPTRAGIDPYNKLIDRNGEDNMIDISGQK